MKEKRTLNKNWSVICLVNLFIASILGVIMRYKMIYALPDINQGNVLNAHGHFVFQGWITLVLFSCFIVYIVPEDKQSKQSYIIQFWLMELSAFGMLVTFFLYGYNVLSIAFSALSQFAFYWFAVQFFLDLRKVKISWIVKGFSIAAIIAALISSLGPYALAYFSITGRGSPIVTRGSGYYYLHFQYNGWFSFGVFALFFQWLDRKKIHFNAKSINLIFILFIIGLIPGYALSLIGYINKFWVYTCSWFAIVTQLLAIIILVKEIWKNKTLILVRLFPITQYLWGVALLSLLVKSIFQALSLHPDLAIVAFSLRPLVIGYLHLIFICFVSFFLIGYLIQHFKFQFATSMFAKSGLLLFSFFSILNEILLFLQAFGYYFSFHYPKIPKYLLWVTLLMFLSLLLFLIGQFKKNLKE